MAKSIEEQTAKLPSDTFLWLPRPSTRAPPTPKNTGRRKNAPLRGPWAPRVLLFGAYNKLRKKLSSCRTARRG